MKYSIALFSEYFPEDIELKRFILQSQYRNAEFSDCINTCNQIIEAEPEHNIALKFRARSLTKIGANQREIRNAWNKFLEGNEEDAEAINNIARSLISDNQLESASDMISRLIDIDPDYGPVNTTIANLVSAKGELDFDSESLGGHRVTYARGEYSKVISDLGGLGNWKNWDEDESVFIFRSLVKQELYEAATELYRRSRKEFSNSHRIISEIITSARETRDDELLSKEMTALGSFSTDDSDAAKHYLRHLVYFGEPFKHVCSEINNILEIHGESLLLSTLRFILKSGRYEIIEGAGISPSVSEFLDPIQGTLANENNGQVFSILWEELDQKISHALSSRDSTYTSANYNTAMLESGAIFPTIHSTGSLLESVNTGSVDEISPDKIEEICCRLSSQAFEFDSESSSSNLAIFFSENRITKKLTYPIERVIRLSFKFTLDGLLIRENETSGSGEELISEFIHNYDPRNNLGRFHNMTKEVGARHSMIISSMLRIVSEHYPSEVWFDDSLPITKIAATILGYPDNRIKNIQ
jgi:tetratricopeptide (TPR) repeat protein